METEVDFVVLSNRDFLSEPILQVPRLLRRYCDCSAFLLKEVDKAVEQVVEHVPKSKVLNILTVSSKHKHVNVRNKCALFVAITIETMVALSMSRIFMTIKAMRELSSKDLQSLLPVMSSFTQEGNAETRAHGRRGLASVAKLMDPREFDQLVLRHLPEAHARKLIDMSAKFASGNGNANPTNGRKAAPLTNATCKRVTCYRWSHQESQRN